MLIHRIKRWMQDEFLRHTGIMMLGSQLANLFNLVYHLVMVRILSYGEYGNLNALVVLSLYFCQLSSPLQPALARFLSGYLGCGQLGQANYVVRKATRDICLLSIVILCIFIIAAAPLAGQQQIKSPSCIIMVGAIVAVSIMTVVPQAFLQAAQLFGSLAIIGAAAAFAKLAVGTGLVFAGRGVMGGLWGFMAGSVLIVAAGFLLTRGYFNSRHVDPGCGCRVPLSPIYRYCIPAGLFLISFTVLTNGDITLVKKFFSPEEAGLYSVAQMVGKIILFLPGAVAIVVFPHAASAQARGYQSRHLLIKGLIASSVLCAAGTFACILFPEPVLRLITGKCEPECARLVMLFAPAMSFYALVSVVAFYNLSINNTHFIKYLIIAAIAQTATIYLFHPSLEAVLWILDIFSVISFLAMLSLSRESLGNPHAPTEVN